MKSSFNQIPNKLTMFEAGYSPAKSNITKSVYLHQRRGRLAGLMLITFMLVLELHGGRGGFAVMCKLHYMWLYSERKMASQGLWTVSVVLIWSFFNGAI